MYTITVTNTTTCDRYVFPSVTQFLEAYPQLTPRMVYQYFQTKIPPHKGRLSEFLKTHTLNRHRTEKNEFKKEVSDTLKRIKAVIELKVERAKKTKRPEQLHSFLQALERTTNTLLIEM